MKHLLLILMATAALAAFPAGRVSVGFWNAENFFDTINNPLTADDAYTPAGYYRWTADRYAHKVASLARVLDDMNLDVVGMSEVENQGVLHDLMRACKTDYACIHLTSDDRRGMDVALLYKGDKFFPDPSPAATRLIKSAAGREFLYVRGKLAGHRVDFIICHLPSNLNSREQRRTAMASLSDFVQTLLRDDPAACPIVMGDFNASPTDRVMRETFGTGRSPMDGAAFLFNPLLKLAREGMGSYAYNGRWHMYDNIFLGSIFLGGAGLRYDSCGVFIREYMLTVSTHGRRGYPLRTFSANTYLGGASDHLPVYASLVF